MKFYQKSRTFTCRCGTVVETVSRTQKYCSACGKHNKARASKLYNSQKRHEHRA